MTRSRLLERACRLRLESLAHRNRRWRDWWMTREWFGGFSLICDMSMRIFTEKADLLAVVL